MNFTHRLALPVLAIAAALPAVAFAESVYHPAPGELGFTEHWDHLKSTRTRAEVQAEVEAARKDGTLALIQHGLPLPGKSTGAAKSRKQVVDELLNESATDRLARQSLLIGG